MARANGVVVVEVGGEVPTNGAAEIIRVSEPYVVTARIKGVSDLLFHRWNCEAVEEKANAAKGSKAKKTDNIESYVFRNDEKEICLPGEYLRGAIVNAAKFRQDPRSPRKSAMDLYKAGVVSLTPLASLGTTRWDYEHRCRATIQKTSSVTRTRPAIKAGWEAEIELMVNLPEYIHPDALYEVIANAGRLIGVGDFRPTYGRFQLIQYRLQK